MIEVLNVIFTTFVAILSTIVTVFLFFHNYDKELALRLSEIQNRIKALEDNGNTNASEIQDEINALNVKMVRQTKLFFRLVNYLNIDLREKINQLIVNSGSQNLMKTFKDDRSSNNGDE